MDRFKKLLLGKPRDIRDPDVFHKISLAGVDRDDLAQPVSDVGYGLIRVEDFAVGHGRSPIPQATNRPCFPRKTVKLLFWRMRLWSLHPSHLDARGLVALWREALLAQKVLRGLTRGYKHHPQLERFRAHPKPVAAIATYLAAVSGEAVRRGYSFDARRIAAGRTRGKIPVTRGQLAYERGHLLRKLKARAPKDYAVQRKAKFKTHPLFRVKAGGVAGWERP